MHELLKKAKALLHLNKPFEAISYCESLLPSVTDKLQKVELLNVLADLSVITKNFSRAIEYCEQSLGLLNKQVRINALLGDIYLMQKQYKFAVQYYTDALNIASSNDNKLTFVDGDDIHLETIYANLAESLLAINDLDSSSSWLDYGLKLYPESAELLVGKANVAFANKQFNDAKQYIQTALYFNPKLTKLQTFIDELEGIIVNEDVRKQTTNNDEKQQEWLNIELPKTESIPLNNEVIEQPKQSSSIKIKPTSEPMLPLLTVCMIVKNEEEMLSGCLDSIKDVADEIIIVDTGSDDKTIEIAQGYGAKIHHFRWIDDFAAARNESLKYATGLWILYLDADERLVVASQKQIRQLISTASEDVGAYFVTIESDHRKLDGSSEKHRGGYPRLFRNLIYPNISFIGRVHEQISPSIIAQKKNLVRSDIVIEHLGYNLSADEMSDKVQRNYRMLIAHVNEDPTNGYAWFQLGQTLGQMELWQQSEDAIEFSIKCGDLKNSVYASATATLAQLKGKKKDYQQALHWANESLKTVPNQIFAMSLKAHTLLYMGRKEEAKQVFRQTLNYLRTNKEMPRSGFDIDISEEVILNGIKECE